MSILVCACLCWFALHVLVNCLLTTMLASMYDTLLTVWSGEEWWEKKLKEYPNEDDEIEAAAPLEPSA